MSPYRRWKMPVAAAATMKSTMIAACILTAVAGVVSCGARPSGGTISAPAEAAAGPGAPDAAGAGGVDVDRADWPAPAGGAREFRVLEVAGAVLSGPAPRSDADFDRLASLGVRTIISVDGQRPDVERAGARGMRCVHLPTAYRGIPRGRQAELARAVRDLPGPVYVHCQDGKHRGPAAAAIAAILLGTMTPEEGVALLRRAGTSMGYPGLYTSVRVAAPASASVIDAASASFPEAALVPGFVGAMVELEQALEDLEKASRGGWRARTEGPGPVGAADAGMLAGLLRGARHDPYVRERDSSEFLYFLLLSADRAKDLERAIVAGRGAGELDAGLRLVASSCMDCHVRFRNE